MATSFMGGGWNPQRLVVFAVIALVCLGLLWVLAGVVGIPIPGWVMTMAGIVLAGIFVLFLIRLMFYVGGNGGNS